MGGDRAVHVLDDALHGSDAVSTSLVLAAALRRMDFDLVICGMASTDAEMSVVAGDGGRPAPRTGRRERRGVASGDDSVTVERDTDDATEEVVAPAARTGVGHRPVRRGPVPVVQGNRRRQEEAGRPPGRWRIWRSRPIGSVPVAPPRRSWRSGAGHPARPARSSPTRATPPRGWPISSPPTSFCRPRALGGCGEHSPGPRRARDGVIRKPSLELLTLARRLGDPAAVVHGDASDALIDALGRYGATTVYAVTPSPSRRRTGRWSRHWHWPNWPPVPRRPPS